VSAVLVDSASRRSSVETNLNEGDEARERRRRWPSSQRNPQKERKTSGRAESKDAANGRYSLFLVAAYRSAFDAC